MTQVLVLNASYEPHMLVAGRRAIVLVLEEKAEIVEEGTEEFRSARLRIPIPRVIRLLRYVRVPYRRSLPLNRRAVLSRDGGKCAYCDGKAETIDHVIPRSRGGKHVWENVVAACGRCNGKKADRLLSELGWTLRQKPYAPKGTAWMIVGVASVDEAWTPYLGMENLRPTFA